LLEERNCARAERYLRMATETASFAQKADDASVAEAYMHIATVWTRLAEEATAHMPANDAPPQTEDDTATA
jgi:hypothetical protein